MNNLKFNELSKNELTAINGGGKIAHKVGYYVGRFAESMSIVGDIIVHKIFK